MKPRRRTRLLAWTVAGSALAAFHCSARDEAVLLDEARVEAHAGTTCDGAERLLSRPPVGPVARDAERLYWVVRGEGAEDARLESVARDGSDRRSYTGVFQERDAYLGGLDDRYLYAIVAGKIVRIPKVPAEGDGKSVKTLFTPRAGVHSPTELRVYDQMLYFVGHDRGREGYLAVVPKSGGEPVQFRGGLDGPDGLAVTTDWVYVATPAGTVLVARGDTGRVAGPTGMDPSVPVDRAHFYEVRRRGAEAATITRRPHGRSDGAATKIYTAPPGYEIEAMVIDGADAWFVESAPASPRSGSIKRVPTRGGAPAKEIVVGLGAPSLVFTDETFVYWVESDSHSRDGGGLFRAPKSRLEDGRSIECSFAGPPPPDGAAGEEAPSDAAARAAPDPDDAVTEDGSVPTLESKVPPKPPSDAGCAVGPRGRSGGPWPVAALGLAACIVWTRRRARRVRPTKETIASLARNLKTPRTTPRTA